MNHFIELQLTRKLDRVIENQKQILEILNKKESHISKEDVKLIIEQTKDVKKDIGLGEPKRVYEGMK